MEPFMILPQQKENGIGVDIADLAQQLAKINTLILCREGNARSKGAAEEIPNAGYLEGGLQWLDELRGQDTVTMAILAGVKNIVLFVSESEFKKYHRVILIIQSFHEKEIRHISELIEIHRLNLV